MRPGLPGRSPVATSSSGSRVNTTAGPTSSSGAITPIWPPGPRERPIALPGTPGIPKVIGQTLAVLPWNDQDAVERLVAERGQEIAAILTEPIMGNTGVIPPKPGYLGLPARDHGGATGSSSSSTR